MSEQNKITEFWSDIQNVKNASPEDIQSDILAYLKLIAEKDAEIERLQGEVVFWKQAADNQKDNNMKLISVIHEKDEKGREAINIWETATPEDDFDDIMHAVIDELKDSLAL